MSPPEKANQDAATQLEQFRHWAQELGFSDLGIANIDLSQAERRLQRWLGSGFHGSMAYMQHHGNKRTRPQELIPGTLSILSLRMDYLPENQREACALLDHPEKAYISRYALGRDYHKLIRQRLKKLALKISASLNGCAYRVFTDSAPVMEKPIAQKAGLGWIGKHTNLLCRESGSWFFLGEIYLDYPLPETGERQNHCGDCTSCIDICPTAAIIEPYVLDARKCISYLTIENDGDIPLQLRSKIGNRIYGCDDCQLFCPWNRFASLTAESDFSARHQLDQAPLADLFRWTEAEFLSRFEGSPIRRIGYQNWLRNIAVALGNANKTQTNLDALLSRRNHDNPRVLEHILWAIDQYANREPGSGRDACGGY